MSDLKNKCDSTAVSDELRLKFSPGLRLMLLFGFMLLMICVVGSASGLFKSLFQLSPRDNIIITSILQNILAFALPAFIAAWFSGEKALSGLSANKAPAWKPFVGIVIIYFISIPWFNYIVEINNNISFPDSMKQIEHMFREWENNAAKSTDLLLSSSSVTGLLISVATIGIITGIGEELFFRGALQNILVPFTRSATVAVWTSAFIFSMMHFQFFGFVPRLLMGAFFGYILLWTGSVWNSMIAHALNNSMVVIVAWLGYNNCGIGWFEKIGVPENSFPWVALASFVTFVLILMFTRDYFFKSNANNKLV